MIQGSMNAIRTTYDDLPETVTLTIPKEMAHKRAEIIVLVDESGAPGSKSLTDFFGAIPDFPERAPQGEYEKRESL
ncbi:MAG: hypothetical protein J0L53_05515 [Spirochaetes bacterium]|nr:hypothetical protein [Spirochaetota bacterium]